MKKALILLVFLGFMFTAYGEVYLTYNTETNEIIDLSPDKSCVVQEGWERVELKGEIKDYNAEFQYHPKYYKYKNGKFVLNIQKISADELKKEESSERAQEYQLIQDTLNNMAIDELNKKGIILKHFKKKED